MKIKTVKPYQGWATVELGNRGSEILPAGEHNVPKAFADYLKKTHPHLFAEDEGGVAPIEEEAG